MGCDLRDRPRRSGRRQLRGAAAADHEPLLDGMRQDALRRAHLGDLDPAKLSPEEPRSAYPNHLARSPTNRHEP